MSLTIVLMVAAGSPALAAAVPLHRADGWLAGGGQFEPSTTYDSPRFMFANASNGSIDRVYLNGYFVSVHATTGIRTDTNVDGGHVLSPTGNVPVAWLGFWRDCNEDGYIGLKSTPMAYGSQTTYPVELSEAAGYPINVSICPPGGRYWLNSPSTGQANAFVDEFRWIGPDAGCDVEEPGCPGSGTTAARVCVPPGANPPAACAESPLRPQTDGINDVTDNASRVWADWERPGGGHVPYGPLLPLPRGTFADSDGTLRFLDEATLGTVFPGVPGWNAKPNVGACDQPNPTFLGGSGNTCGAWPLYQVRRLVNDSSCASANSAEGRQDPGCWEPDPLVTTWDIESDDDGDGNPCNDGADQAVVDPSTNRNLVRVSLPDPAVGPGSVNPNVLADGSVAGTLEHQERATAGTDTGANSVDSRCGPDGDDALTARFCGIGVIGCGFLETESSPSQYKHAEPSMVLNFTTDTRIHHLQAFGLYDAPAFEGANVIGGPSGALNSGKWTSNSVWTGRPPRTGWGYTAATWATFYADVTTQAVGAVVARTALPAGAQDAHTYGSEFCDAFTTGPANVNPANDWECSTTEWGAVRATYLSDDPRRYGAMIGDKYDLRDVDCYDNTVSEENRVTNRDLDGLRVGIAACADA